MKINTNENSIEKIFGYKTIKGYEKALVSDTDEGKRLKALSTIFLILINPEHKRVMEIGILLKLLLENLLKVEIKAPVDVIKLCDDRLSTDELYDIASKLSFTDSFTALKKVDNILKDTK